MSVIIPTYRRPRELREALESIARQTGIRVEVIVIDDCPDASARPVTTAFGGLDLTYLPGPTPRTGRPALLRNLGARQARGELVHFLDDDDLVPDGHYAAMRDLFLSSPGTNIVFGHITPFGTDPDSVAREASYFADAARRAGRCRRLGSRWRFAATMFFRPTLLVCSAAMLRASCLARLDGFDPDLPLMEDVDFYARAIRRYGATFVDRPTLHYRIGPSLMHQPHQQAGLIVECYRRMQARYRREHGGLDFLLLKSFAVTTGA